MKSHDPNSSCMTHNENGHLQYVLRKCVGLIAPYSAFGVQFGQTIKIRPENYFTSLLQRSNLAFFGSYDFSFDSQELLFKLRLPKEYRHCTGLPISQMEIASTTTAYRMNRCDRRIQ